MMSMKSTRLFPVERRTMGESSWIKFLKWFLSSVCLSGEILA
jgi:hypothetical protein